MRASERYICMGDLYLKRMILAQRIKQIKYTAFHRWVGIMFVKKTKSFGAISLCHLIAINLANFVFFRSIDVGTFIEQWIVFF